MFKSNQFEVIRRFYKHTRRTGKECLEWTGTVSKKKPNAKPIPIFTFKGKAYSAYRFIYQLINGQVPSSVEIRRSCGNHLCVEPAHLYEHTLSRTRCAAIVLWIRHGCLVRSGDRTREIPSARLSYQSFPMQPKTFEQAQEHVRQATACSQLVHNIFSNSSENF